MFWWRAIEGKGVYRVSSRSGFVLEIVWLLALMFYKLVMVGDVFIFRSRFFICGSILYGRVWEEDWGAG